MEDYKRRAPRTIGRKWIMGFIRKTENNKAEQEAFEFLCEKLTEGKTVKEATKITRNKFETISIMVKQSESERFCRVVVHVGTTIKGSL